MLRAVVVVAVIVVALLQGGSLRHFATLRLRWPVLALAAIGLQLVIFAPAGATPLPPDTIPALYLLSMGILIIWVAANRHIPGMLLMAAGLLLNTVAIAANGGAMPVSPASAAYAGRIVQYSGGERPMANNSWATDTAQLWLLTDILAVPAWVPFANVFSIGDVVLTLGVCWLCYRTVRGAHAGMPAASYPERIVTDE